MRILSTIWSSVALLAACQSSASKFSTGGPGGGTSQGPGIASESSGGSASSGAAGTGGESGGVMSTPGKNIRAGQLTTSTGTAISIS